MFKKRLLKLKRLVLFGDFFIKGLFQVKNLFLLLLDYLKLVLKLSGDLFLLTEHRFEILVLIAFYFNLFFDCLTLTLQ